MVTHTYGPNGQFESKAGDSVEVVGNATLMQRIDMLGTVWLLCWSDGSVTWLPADKVIPEVGSHKPA